MSRSELNTTDKILQAAIGLMEKKSFQSVTMKEIATVAQVSEMTVFRHFENKKNLLEAAVKKYSYILSMQEIFLTKIIWNLEEDLLLISKIYHEGMKKNKSIFLIGVHERNTMPEIRKLSLEYPRQLKKLLVDYFVAMQQKNRMVKSDAEAQAIAFMFMNFGYFFATVIGEEITDIPSETFIKESVQIFARGLQP